jgi:hypothetical protein
MLALALLLLVFIVILIYSQELGEDDRWGKH